MSRSRVHGESLRAARLKAGWTQQQLAEKAHVNRATVAALEGGTRRASDDVLKAVATALGLKPEQLEDVAPEQMITVADVAVRLKVSQDTVRRRLIHTGQLPAHKIGGQLRIPAAAVDRYLAAQRVAVVA